MRVLFNRYYAVLEEFFRNDDSLRIVARSDDWVHDADRAYGKLALFVYVGVYVAQML